MKKLIITITLGVLYGNMFSQVPGTTTYPNGSTNTTPGNPGQPVQPYNGTNPGGVPNQNNGNNNTIPDPAKPGNTYPGNTTPVNPGTPANPGSTYPPSTPGSPNSTSPVPNTVPVTPNHINRLYQDPARTPREPQSADPVRTTDGSTGKYKKDHKEHNGKDFAKNKKHIKTSKTHSDNGREKAPRSTTIK